MLLRKRAEDILDMVEKTRDEFRSMDDITGGDIHIGGGETHAIKCVARAAIDLQKRYPNIRYHFHSGNADDVMESLDRGLLDYCLFVTPVDLSKYSYVTLPAKETWGVIMRKDSPLAAKKSIKANDLIKQPLICSRQALQNEMVDWFGEKFDKLRIVATYNLFYNASILVEEGAGYMIALDNLANTGRALSLSGRFLQNSNQDCASPGKNTRCFPAPKNSSSWKSNPGFPLPRATESLECPSFELPSFSYAEAQLF